MSLVSSSLALRLPSGLKTWNLKRAMKSLCPRGSQNPWPGPTNKLPPDHTIPPPFRNVFNVGIGISGPPPGQGPHSGLPQVSGGNSRVTFHVPSNNVLGSLLSSSCPNTKSCPTSRVSRTASVIPGIHVSSFVFIASSPLLIYEGCLSCNRLPYPDSVSSILSLQGHHLLSAGPVTVPDASSCGRRSEAGAGHADRPQEHWAGNIPPGRPHNM